VRAEISKNWVTRHEWRTSGGGVRATPKRRRGESPRQLGHVRTKQRTMKESINAVGGTHLETDLNA
jgi:hypothetical protein